MSSIIAAARRVAADAPERSLACPICGIALKGANLERHLGKLHPGQDDAGTSWSGGVLFGGRLDWVDGELRRRGAFGLRHRAVARPRSVTVGSTAVSWLGAHKDYGTSGDRGPSAAEKPGVYVQVRGDDSSITVRCRSGAGLRKAWTGWEAGPQARSWDVTVQPDAFVALLYLLAESGVLRHKTD